MLTRIQLIRDLQAHYMRDLKSIVSVPKRYDLSAAVDADTKAIMLLGILIDLENASAACRAWPTRAADMAEMAEAASAPLRDPVMDYREVPSLQAVVLKHFSEEAGEASILVAASATSAA